jgi:hypothetical protein
MQIVQPRARRRVMAAVAIVALAAGSGASCSRLFHSDDDAGGEPPRPSSSMPHGGSSGPPESSTSSSQPAEVAPAGDDPGGTPGGDDHGSATPGGAAPGAGGGTPGGGAPAGGGKPGGGKPAGGTPSGGKPAGGTPGGGGANPGGGTPAAGGGTANCPNVEIVTARGTGESQNAAGGLAGLNNGIAAQVPGTKIYQVVYPASADFLNSPPVGTRDALAHMTTKAAQCANTRFFVTGYSQGGMVMTGVLQQLPGNLQPRIIGGVMYGNPYYKGNSPSAQGPDKAAQGIIPSGIPASYGARIHDYCAQGDTVCGSGAKAGSGGLPASGISAAHLTYPRSQLEKGAITWAVGLIKSS